MFVYLLILDLCHSVTFCIYCYFINLSFIEDSLFNINCRSVTVNPRKKVQTETLSTHVKHTVKNI